MPQRKTITWLLNPDMSAVQKMSDLHEKQISGWGVKKKMDGKIIVITLLQLTVFAVLMMGQEIYSTDRVKWVYRGSDSRQQYERDCSQNEMVQTFDPWNNCQF